MKIYEGERVHIETRPLVSGQPVRLVVVVTANTVTEASADGTNAALVALTKLHYEVAQAIDSLVGVRHHIERDSA